MASKIRVLLIGSGGVGTIAAYALESGGQAEVTSVLRSNYAKVQESGFSIDSIDHGKGIRGWKPSAIRNSIPDVANEQIAPFDFIVATTKNIPDVSPTIVEVLTPAVTPNHTIIVLLQNGLNIEKPIVSRFPANTVLSGVSLIGATETSLGVIVQNEPDVSKIGPFPNQAVPITESAAAAHRFIAAYSASGKADCTFDADVKFTRWRKLVYNSSYNVMAAILGLDVTRMRAYEHVIDDLILPAMMEIMAIAKADGVVLPEELPHEFIVVDSPDSWFMPSMGQDAAKGNYTEFENIVGEPLREAQRLGIPCPVLQTSYAILKGLQAKTMEARGLIKPEFNERSKYRE